MSNRIVGVILFAFLVFVTMKGDLLGYLQVVGLAPGGEQPSGPAPIASVKTGGGGGLFGKISSAIGTATKVASIAGL